MVGRGIGTCHEPVTTKIEKMNSFQISLDKYLTSEPDYSFEYWCEAVTEAFTDSFFDANEDWIMTNGGLCEKWFNKLIHKSPIEAAQIIERACNIYKVNLP